MAVLYPVILVVVLGMFQISLYWHTANAAAAAADAGVDAGRVYEDDPTLARAEADAAALAILATTVPGGGEVRSVVGADTITVTVAAVAPRVIGWGQWRVESVAEAPIEDFVPADER
jgi:Flp pilus assembly protein TadG